jgi:hypothetical protein
MKASWKLSHDSRYAVINGLLKAGFPVTEDLHIALNKAVNEEQPEARLVYLLLQHGASPLTNCCKTLIDATQRAAKNLLPDLLDRDISEKQMAWVFKEGITKQNSTIWLTVDGLDVFRILLAKGARGDGPSAALATVIELSKTKPETPELYDQFVDTLLDHEVDINFDNGVSLQMAASKGDSKLIAKLLQRKPNTQSLSMAFHRIFDTALSEEEALELVCLLAEYADGETRVDVMFTDADSHPVLFQCLDQYPRSTKLLKALLDAGFYYDQTANYCVVAELENEPVTLLTWALLQPQKKISSGIIQMLIETGAKINFETRLSRTTPLMLAIQARRPDVVKMLLLEGAEVDVSDLTGNTPLAMATQIGGELSITIMSNLLAAGASKNDGSLHNAARELNLSAVQVLVEYGHDLDFPSHLHGGRSALGELCLHAASTGELTAVREKTMEKAMAFLIENGSDLTVKSEGKSVLLLALESVDPVTTARVLLKAGMWKNINKPFNNYTDGKFTYSPTMYVSRILPDRDLKDQLLTLLRANRGEDIYYANCGPQPDDAVGLPEDLEIKERERKARLERLATESEEHSLAITRNRELAAVQSQIFAAQADLEDSRRRRLQASELEALQSRAQIEEEIFNAAMRRKRGEQSTDLAHQKRLADAGVQRTKAIGEAELEMTEKTQRKMLEYERKVGNERLDNAKNMSAIRIAEREDVDKLEREADSRFKGRVAEQRRLVESQTALAQRLTSAGVNGRRQIGYITGELD